MLKNQKLAASALDTGRGPSLSKIFFPNNALLYYRQGRRKPRSKVIRFSQHPLREAGRFNPHEIHNLFGIRMQPDLTISFPNKDMVDFMLGNIPKVCKVRKLTDFSKSRNHTITTRNLKAKLFISPAHNCILKSLSFSWMRAA